MRVNNKKKLEASGPFAGLWVRTSRALRNAGYTSREQIMAGVEAKGMRFIYSIKGVYKCGGMELRRWLGLDQPPAANPSFPTPRLYRVILPVDNIERAAIFYGAVLGTPGKRVSPGRHYFECGGTILVCYDPVADGDGRVGKWRFHPLQYLYFAVPDLEAAIVRVRLAGGWIEQEIKTMPWGERLFYARDPLGSWLSFVDEGTVFTG